MMNIFLWTLAILWIVVVLFFVYMKRVPHGWVQFRTGLVLRFMPHLDSQPVVELGQSIDAFIEKKLSGIKKSLPVDEVKEIQLPTRHGDIDARIYQKNDQNDSHLLVLIHGGGWCIGSLNTYEEISRRLVTETGLPLISLGYSLAPEHKFPHAHEECLDAISWISEHSQELGFANQKLILIGDSAGGNLIISTVYDCSEAVRSSIDKLVAVYPAVDSRKVDYPSFNDYARGYYLTRKAMTQFTEGLISSKKDLKDIRLSPLYQEALPTFPETFVLTAEFDPIRDQAEAFALKLHAEGISIKLKRYTQTVHAFFGFKDFGSKGILAIKDTSSFIQDEPIKGLSKLG